MEFAIVRFTSEEDVPGIISTRWIDIRGNSCWFPNVRTEKRKNSLMIAHATPKNDWVKYPIRIVKKFSSYHSACRHLKEEEAASKLEAEDDCLRSPKRKRKTIPDHCEESSSGNQNRELKIKIEPHSSTSLTSIDSTYFLTTATTSNSTSILPDQEDFSSNQPNDIAEVNCILQSSTSAVELSQIQELNDKIETIENNQKDLWQVMEDLVETSKRIEQKLDLFARNCEDQDKLPVGEDNEELKLISTLPLGVEDFIKLDEKIAQSSSFKKRLLNFCLSSGGPNNKDPKIFVCSLLRKLIVDEVGEEYSLTGKFSEKHPRKKSFEKTETYKFFLEICHRIFKVVRVSEIRVAISDWLMQAKFRKNRREQRAAEK